MSDLSPRLSSAMQSDAYDHVWFWRARPLHADLTPHDRKGQRCRVVARGAMNSVLVEFHDGWRVVTSRYAVREVRP